ncbi:hypothetical protein F5Y01DRAFT_171190 [Xylaria sp. FL0043]|nr:hypothetical protein F5Y01DRAFT_171190 [Xylaria sp. FL0043]
MSSPSDSDDPLDSMHGICGNAMIEPGEREMADAMSRRIEGNVPRPLYRHWTEDTDSVSLGRQLQIDQGALKQRRRLSLGYGHQMLSSESLRNVAELPSERCCILDLPAEIRCLIWEYAVGNRTIHIFYSNPAEFWEERGGTVPKLRCVECVYRPSPNGWENSEPLQPSCADCGVVWNFCVECRGRVAWRDGPSGQRGTCYTVDVDNGWQPLALLTTCRKIYTEGIHILYSTNTFRFPLPIPWLDEPHTQPKPIEDFASTLLPQRLEQITRISVGIWFPQFKALDDVLARNLPGLRYLELRARIPSRIHKINTDPDLGPLSQLVMRVRSSVPRAKVVLRADLDYQVSPRLGTQLPEGLEVVARPDEAWDKSGFIFRGY